jgi:hypothetical protein
LGYSVGTMHHFWGFGLLHLSRHEITWNDDISGS